MPARSRVVRTRPVALALLILAAAPLAAVAQEGTRASPPGPGQSSGQDSEQVAACDSLVALRQLAAGAHEDRVQALAQASGQSGCRTVARAEIGAVERRAMFGGAPYECLALRSGGCVWVLP